MVQGAQLASAASCIWDVQTPLQVDHRGSLSYSGPCILTITVKQDAYKVGRSVSVKRCDLEVLHLLACRYVDMIVTDGVRAALRTRAQVSVCMRRVLDEAGFIEVETPMLEASAGGADARPFVTWHNALQRPYVLRIATCAFLSVPANPLLPPPPPPLPRPGGGCL